MALYSEIIDTNSKWMWSSITTGAISLLFLAGAFWGLSSSVNGTSSIFIEQSAAFVRPTITKKIISKAPVTSQSPKTNNNQVQKVNRSTKQNSSFAKTPNTQLTRKTITISPSLPKKPNKIITLPAPETNTNTNTNTSLLSKPVSKTSNTSPQQSNLSRKSLSQTQLASLKVATPKSVVVPKVSQISPSPIAEPSAQTPFKIVDVNIKVKKGDTLLKILKQNGATTSEATAIVNKLKPHVKVHELDVGQPLTLTLNRRTNNDSIHPVKLIIPLGYRASKPEAILKDRISISYNTQNALTLDLPTDNLSAITMRPKKPLKAPKFTPAPQKALDNKSTQSLNNKIASLSTKDTVKVKAGGTRQAYYRIRSRVKGSFKKTVAAQRVPKDVQSRLMSVYNQTASSKKVKSGDVLELFYDQTETAAGKMKKLGKLLFVNFRANGKVYTYYRFGNQFYDSNGKSINASAGSNGSGGVMSLPVPGARMSSKFGMRRHPVYRRWKMHSGTDFAAPRGTPIYAAASGVVTIARWYGGAGRYVQIDHQNSYNSGYMHMTRFAKGMKKGRKVKKGQIIGYVGSTGTATGNHLHFEVRKNGKKINPMGVVGRGRIAATGKLSGSQLSKFNKERDRIRGRLNQTAAIERIAAK